MFRSAFRSAFRPAIMPVINKLMQSLRNRFSYSFDGIDDRALPFFKVINVESDIDISFRTGPTVTWGATDRTIVSQCLTATYSGAAGKEFTLYFNAVNGGLQGLIGGNYTTTAVGAQLAPNSSYRWQLIGQSLKVWFNGVLVLDTTTARGPARESTAQTVIGAQTHGAINTFRGYFIGQILDLSINGVEWPLSERTSLLQLPKVENLTPVVFNRFNNASTGTLPITVDAEGFSVATLNGAHAWGYLGFNFQVQPGVTYLAETLADYVSSNIFYAAENSSAGGAVQVVSYTNQPANQIVRQIATASQDLIKTNMLVTRNFPAGLVGTVRAKLIRVAPLWLVELVQRLTNGDFASGTAGWFVTGGGSMNVNNGQATLTTVASQASRFERGVTLEPNAYYEASCDLISLSGVTAARLNIIRDAAGNYRGIAGMGKNSPGKIVFVFQAPATDAIVQVVGDSTNAGTVVVDNVSIRKITSLCNPCALINTNSDRWSEMLE